MDNSKHLGKICENIPRTTPEEKEEIKNAGKEYAMRMLERQIGSFCGNEDASSSSGNDRGARDAIKLEDALEAMKRLDPNAKIVSDASDKDKKELLKGVMLLKQADEAGVKSGCELLKEVYEDVRKM